MGLSRKIERSKKMRNYTKGVVDICQERRYKLPDSHSG